MEPTQPSQQVTLLQTPRDADRRVAGVCGALARRWHVDPLLIRVAAVLLLLSSGVGAVLYTAGWLFMPARPEARAPIAHVFPGAPRWSRNRVVWTVVIFSVVVAMIVGKYTPGGAMPLAILVAVWFFARRRKNRTSAPAPNASMTPGQGAPVAGAWEPWAGSWSAADAHQAHPDHPPTDFDLAVQAWQRRLHQVAVTQDSAPRAFSAAPAPPPAGAPAAVTRRPAPSWGRGLALLGVAAGVFLLSLLAFGASPVDGAPTKILLLPASLALGVIAIGLLVGSRIGRPRLAVAAGLVLSLIVVASIVSPFDSVVPTVVSTTASDVAELPIDDGMVVEGQVLELDLSSLVMDGSVDEAGNVTLPITVRGSLVSITVPANYTVVVEYSLNGGLLDLPGEGYAGDASGTWTSQTRAGPTLTLVLDIDHGTVSIS